ncbi:hypothetical protein Ae201684P_009383 [Aphanomyces euteiches]|uniref:EF-hand domain-containing protein n=1 Tax=Aphanomyces euteiches TaxID=100861 RepID=A0A6G0WNC2_9STRA|nr:hypothetical protein Ae201684_013435 [Aphanomyces euteiches]KAH9063119.1 hypothetical protein Ae201684P_009383 [Aphanomyces euteiches]KAH9145452.1 hypothetical protein AeRB84_010626 [Aphanomyces euteiches]
MATSINSVVPVGLPALQTSPALVRPSSATAIKPEDGNLMPPYVFGLSATSWLRSWCIRAFFSNYFHVFVYALIVLNAIVLAFDEPQHSLTADPTLMTAQDLKKAQRRQVINWIEFGFTVVFTFEMLIKLLAGGVFRGQYAYFRKWWNWLDCGLVLLGWTSCVLWISVASHASTSSDLLPYSPLPDTPFTFPPFPTMSGTSEGSGSGFTPLPEDGGLFTEPPIPELSDAPSTESTANLDPSVAPSTEAPETLDPSSSNGESTSSPIFDLPTEAEPTPESSPDSGSSGLDPFIPIVPDTGGLINDTTPPEQVMTSDTYALNVVLNLVTFFRMLRVFKVLRGIRLSKHAQALVQSLFESLRLLVNVIVLLLLIFALFAIIGVALFQGSLHQQCDNDYVTPDGYLKADQDGNLASGNGFRCSFTAGRGRECQNGGTCVVVVANSIENKNPNFGFTSFDNFGMGFLTVVKIASLCNWGTTMWNLAQAKGLVAGLYFLLVIPVGGYFVVNLVIAVVSNAYTNKLGDIRDEFVTAKLEHKQKALQAQKHLRRPSIIDMVLTKPLPVTKLSHIELKTLVTRFSSNDGRIKYKHFIEFFSPSSGVHDTLHNIREFLQSAKAAGLHARSIFRFIDKDHSGDLSRDELVLGFKEIEERVGIKLNDAIVEALHDYLDDDNDGKVTMKQFVAFADPTASKALARLEQKILVEMSTFEQAPSKVEAIFEEQDPTNSGTISVGEFRTALARLGFAGSGVKYLSHEDTMRLSMRSLELNNSSSQLTQKVVAMRCRLAGIIRHWGFTALMNVAIGLQIVCLLLKSHDPLDVALNRGTEDFVYIAQLVLNYLFAFEMALKLVVYGISGYIVDRYNWMDGTLSLLGLCDAFLQQGHVVPPVTVSHFISIARVVRLIQLFRQWPNFRILLETMVASFQGLSPFGFLLVLCMYIFALVGKHLFGNQMTEENGFPTPFYTTFDTVWSSLLTVFQVFSGDAWTDVLYACMRVNPIEGALFVVVVFFTGNYLILNVFLSILLQDFQSDENERHTSYFSTIADADISHYYQVLVTTGSNLIHRLTAGSAIKPPPSIAKRRLRMKVRPMFSKLSSTYDKMSSIDLDDDERNRLHDIADILLFKLDTHTIQAGPREFYECCHGFEVVQFLVSSGFCSTVADAEAMGNRLIELERLTCHAASLGHDADSHLQAMIQATTSTGNEIEDFVKSVIHDIISAAASQDKRYGPAGPFGNNTGVFSIHATPWRNNISEAIEYAKTAQYRRDEMSDNAREAKRHKTLVGTSLGVFGPTHSARRCALEVVMHPVFKYSVLAVVIASCLVAAFDISDTDHAEVYLWADVGIACFFVAEMLLKVVAHGFIWTGRYAYLRNGWNILDFVITLTSVAALVATFAAISNHTTITCRTTDSTMEETICLPPQMSLPEIKSLRLVKGLRLFRALLPLRAIHLYPGMKLVVEAILITLPCVINLYVIQMLLVFMFALAGVELLAGKFMYCSGNDDDKYTLNVTTCLFDIVTSRSWEPLFGSDYNFDSVSNAMLLMMEISTLQGWSAVMHAAMDAPLIGYAGMNPIQNQNSAMALFFIAFVVICGFFMMGLFLGVIVYKFQQLIDEHKGTLLLTASQKKWVATQRQLFALKPKSPPSVTRPEQAWRRKVLDIVEHSYFERLILIVIVASIVSMTLDHYPSSPAFVSTYSQVLWSFTVLFCVEACLKVAAYGPKQYILQNWLDFSILIVCISDDFVTVVNIHVLRVLRIMRIFHLVKNSNVMVSILKTLTMSLPALVNVAVLLMVIAFGYAILGMNLFYNPFNPLFGECIRDLTTFDHLSSSMMILFVVVTGDNWACYMHDATVLYPRVGRVYFLTFLIIGNYIVLNLLVAIIMQNFGDYLDGFDEDEGRPTNTHLDAFAEQWQKLTPDGSLFLPSYKLVSLLRRVPPPLGFAVKSASATPKSAQEIVHYIRSLHARRNHRKEIFYLDIFYTLCHHAMPSSFTVFETPEIEAHLQAKLAARALRHFPDLRSIHLDTATHQFDLTEEFNAARIIQDSWRQRRGKFSPSRPPIKKRTSYGLSVIVRLSKVAKSMRKKALGKP